MGDTLPVRTVRMILGGGVPGWPCGRAGHPVEIYTSSPAVAVVAVVGSTGSGLTPRIYLGGGAGNADRSIMGETDKLRGIPEGPRYRSGVATPHEHQVVAWR
jgi:hypothetical protein